MPARKDPPSLNVIESTIFAEKIPIITIYMHRVYVLVSWRPSRDALFFARVWQRFTHPSTCALEMPALFPRSVLLTAKCSAPRPLQHTAQSTASRTAQRTAQMHCQTHCRIHSPAHRSVHWLPVRCRQAMSTTCLCPIHRRCTLPSLLPLPPTSPHPPPFSTSTDSSIPVVGHEDDRSSCIPTLFRPDFFPFLRFWNPGLEPSLTSEPS